MVQVYTTSILTWLIHAYATHHTTDTTEEVHIFPCTPSSSLPHLHVLVSVTHAVFLDRSQPVCRYRRRCRDDARGAAARGMDLGYVLFTPRGGGREGGGREGKEREGKGGEGKGGRGRGGGREGEGRGGKCERGGFN